MAEPRTAGIPRRIGVIGATSQVARILLPRFRELGVEVEAWSRRPQPPTKSVHWHGPPAPGDRWAGLPVSHWLSLAPAYALPDFFPTLSEAGARHLVVVSSTSLLTKNRSRLPAERAIAQGLLAAESAATLWAEAQGARLTILRPTLVYGYGQDRNVAEIARFICRFGWFPLVGGGIGLRQPLHVGDLAAAALATLAEPPPAQVYVLAGGEVLSYREMVVRIFEAIGRQPLFLPVPLAAFRAAIGVARLLPRFRHWTGEMAARMTSDQVFENRAAERDLGIDFRPFRPGPEDVGSTPLGP